MATEYHAFDDEAVNQAIAAANQHNEIVAVGAKPGADMSVMAAGAFSVHAQCISIVVRNHRICLRLPLGIGNICLPIPISIHDGTAAQACLSICTTWGFPTGLRVRVIVGGHVIVSKTFGRC